VHVRDAEIVVPGADCNGKDFVETIPLVLNDRIEPAATPAGLYLLSRQSRLVCRL
jgi:hypothetical protein